MAAVWISLSDIKTRMKEKRTYYTFHPSSPRILYSNKENGRNDPMDLYQLYCQTKVFRILNNKSHNRVSHDEQHVSLCFLLSRRNVVKRYNTNSKTRASAH